MDVYRLPSENMGGQGVVLTHKQLSDLLTATISRYVLYNWTGDTITGELDASHVIKLYFRDEDMESEMVFLNRVKPLAVTYFDTTHPHGMLFCANEEKRLEVIYNSKTTYSWPVNNTRFVVYKKLQPISEAIQTIKTEIDIFNKVINPLRAHVDFLHRSQYYHRDIKPENIMYDTDTQKAVLIDFGLSRSLQHFTELPLPGVAGTRSFISPLYYYMACFDDSLFKIMAEHQIQNAKGSVLSKLYHRGYKNIENEDNKSFVNQLDKFHEFYSIDFIVDTIYRNASFNLDHVMKANDRFGLARSIAEILYQTLSLPHLNELKKDEQQEWTMYINKLNRAQQIRNSVMKMVNTHTSRRGGSIKATKQLKIKRVIIE